MLHILAQAADYSYNYNGTTGEKAGLAGLAIFSGFFLLIWLAVVVFMVIATWRLFEKAGRPGWASLIPFYNMWVMAEMAGKPGWWGIVGLGAIVPILGIAAGIAAFVLYILICIELAKAFGKDPAYAALLVIVPIIGIPLLAFGDAKYKAPAGVPTAPKAA